MNWRDAHRVAMLSAAHAIADLDADRSGGRVADPFVAAAAAGLFVLLRPLSGLAGLYVRDAETPGIMINARHPLRLQRYTLAHELGHHLLGHATVADDGFSFGGDVNCHGRVIRRPEDEMVAEAFAAWYLMPRKQVRAAVARIGAGIVTPFEVYQLSLRLGASYEATARHLPNLHLAERPALAGWLGPRTRRELLAQRARVAIEPMASQRHDLWLLGPRDDEQQILARPGDRLVLALPEDERMAGWALAGHWASALSNELVDIANCDPAVRSSVGGSQARLIALDVPGVEGESSRERHTLTALVELPGRTAERRGWSVTINVQAPQVGMDEMSRRELAA